MANPPDRLARRARRVLMVGPALDQQGGIAAVERAMLDAWPNGVYRVRHVATYASNHGSSAAKLLRSIPALLRVAWTMASWRPHLVHVHLSQGGSFYRKSIVVMFARLFGARTVLLHAHASRFHTTYEGSGRLRQFWIRSLLGSADRLVVLGGWWRDYYTRLGVAVPIDVLPNPVVSPPIVASYRDRPTVVLSLGELGERKGTYDTLRAIPAILRLHPTAEFWLGGDGDVAQIAAILERVPWGNQVKLLGWVDGPAKEAALDVARVFLLPSHNEGLPVAMLEAMAHGLPVVTTPVGDIPDAITDGQTGFLIRPGDVDAIADRVSRLLGDPELAERIGGEARTRAHAAYDVHVIMPRLLAIYDLADKRKGSAGPTVSVQL